MATTSEILQNVYDRYVLWEQTLIDVQDQFYQDYGRYAQALNIVSTTPADDTTETPDQLDQSPTDFAKSWSDIANEYGVSLPDSVKAQVSLTYYGNPEGWSAVLRHVVDGTLYQRELNYGPVEEDWREQGWINTETGEPL